MKLWSLKKRKKLFLTFTSNSCRSSFATFSVGGGCCPPLLYPLICFILSSSCSWRESLTVWSRIVPQNERDLCFVFLRDVLTLIVARIHEDQAILLQLLVEIFAEDAKFYIGRNRLSGGYTSGSHNTQSGVRRPFSSHLMLTQCRLGCGLQPKCGFPAGRGRQREVCFSSRKNPLQRSLVGL